MIESTENKISYIVGESKVFPFNIRFFRPEDIKCFLNQDKVQTELVRNVDFSVERKANYNNGAKITLLAKKLPVGATLSILRICDITQDLALPESGKLPSAGLENQLDKLTMIAQQLTEEISRSIKVGVSETDANPDALLAGIHEAAAAAEKSAGAAAGSVTACENIAGQISDAAQAAAKSAEDSENSAAAAAESARDAEEKVSAALGKLESEMQTKAQTDFSNVDENLDFVVESWNDGNGNWYRKYRSGWIEQGGISEAAKQTGVNTLTLLIEMADAKYTAIVCVYGETGIYTSTAQIAYASVANLTEISFQYYASTSAMLQKKMWMVKGYAAN